MPHSVLLVDDEKNILLTLSQALQLAGYHTELAGTGKLGLEVALARPVDAVLLDVQLPDMDGLAVLEQLLQVRPGLPVLMMSGHGTIETAVKATRLGARDFLEKPIGRDRLLVALRNALALKDAVEELESLREERAGTRWWDTARRCSGSTTWSSARRRARDASSSPARTAAGRSWWPARSTRTAAGRPLRSSG